jgi:hypothetical protein
MTETPKPQAGTWTLTAPDGRQWKADSPLKCAGLEQRERVPAAVALERIAAAVQEDRDAEAEMRRLLTYAVTYSNMRHVASEFWLRDARHVLGLPESEEARHD